MDRAAPARPEPRLAGITPFTSIDFPGRLAAVVFLQGCPWRCPYCHNPQMQPRQGGVAGPSWQDALAWLETRRGLLDGVVLSGGEPLAQAGVSQAVAQLRRLGFAVGMHTGGAVPTRLAATLPELDWVGFDFKAPFEDYATCAGAAPRAGLAARRSLELLIESGLEFEVRTTVDASLHDAASLKRMRASLLALGVEEWWLQPRRDEQGQTCPHAGALARQMAESCQGVRVRGLD